MRRIWQFGATGGLHLFNVGPGTDRRFISTDAQFPSLNSFQGGLFANQRVPGLQIQTSYWRGGPFAEISFLDSETDPHRGVRYWTAYLYHHDREHRGYTFRRFEANAEHYLPFFNEKRVIAIRGRTDLSYRNPGQLVPFYLQPTVGGSDDLRGFRQFRFSDNNALVVNAEYRWEAFPALDMAIFADGGKVFNRLSEFDLRHLQTAFGVGFRFKTRDTTAFRIDTGFSREGFQIWFKFNDAFYSSRALGR
jgi:hemolysin activation/secretion protein